MAAEAPSGFLDDVTLKPGASVTLHFDVSEADELDFGTSGARLVLKGRAVPGDGHGNKVAGYCRPGIAVSVNDTPVPGSACTNRTRQMPMADGRTLTLWGDSKFTVVWAPSWDNTGIGHPSYSLGDLDPAVIELDVTRLIIPGRNKIVVTNEMPATIKTSKFESWVTEIVVHVAPVTVGAPSGSDVKK